MDGLELLKGIDKSHHPHKVIVISGGGQMDADLCLKLASNYEVVKACLHKPYTAKQLFGAISSAFSSGMNPCESR